MNKNFGKKAKDTITGFSGIVTGHCAYISGCSQYLIAPPAKEGEYKEGRWFDEQRVQFDEKSKVIKLENGKTPGHDISAPIR